MYSYTWTIVCVTIGFTWGYYTRYRYNKQIFMEMKKQIELLRADLSEIFKRPM